MNVSAGETVKFEFKAEKHLLKAYLEETDEFVLEAGEYKFMAGANSSDLPLSINVEL